MEYTGELSVDGFRGVFNGKSPILVQLENGDMRLCGGISELARDLKIVDGRGIFQTWEPRNVQLAGCQSAVTVLLLNRGPFGTSSSDIVSGAREFCRLPLFESSAGDVGFPILPIAVVA